MEKKKKYKVKNKFPDVRKFREQDSGKDVHVGPKKSVLTDCPPDNIEDVWKVTKNEKSGEEEKSEEEEETKLNNTGG